MFKRLRLTFHLFILYGFLCVFLLSLCGYALFVIRDYERTIVSVDREQLPLARIVAAISRHQLDQSLRFNEILMFARTGDREKFELSNEGYGQAGKRMGDDILEGRNLAQRGIDRAESEAWLKALDAIKTLLKGIEKAHGDYEHLGSLLIRSIYQYDFLSKNTHLVSGDLMAAEEEATKHVMFLRATLSALEDETRRLESGIKETAERVKQLSQTLAMDAKQKKESVFNFVLPLLFFAMSMGLLLVFAIDRIQKHRAYYQHQRIQGALTSLSDVLAQLQDTFQGFGPSSQQMEKNCSLQKESFGAAMTNLQEVMRLSQGNVQTFAQIQSLMAKKGTALEQTTLLVQALNKDASDMLESGEETERIVRNLKDTVGQMRMLATNASAEALRSEATHSFAIFTEEIKELAQTTVQVAETISSRMDRAIQGIQADRLHVSQTHQRFSDVVMLAGREAGLLNETVTVIQKQSDLMQDVQEAATHVNVALQTNDSLLEQIETVRSVTTPQLETANQVVIRLKDINSLMPGVGVQVGTKAV